MTDRGRVAEPSVRLGKHYHLKGCEGEKRERDRYHERLEITGKRGRGTSRLIDNDEIKEAFVIVKFEFHCEVVFILEACYHFVIKMYKKPTIV